MEPVTGLQIVDEAVLCLSLCGIDEIYNFFG